jgi:hypothetical protein
MKYALNAMKWIIKKYIFGKKKKQTNSLLLYFMFQVVKSQKMIVLDFSTYLKIYIFKNSPRIKGGEHYEEEFKLAQGPGLDHRKTTHTTHPPPPNTLFYLFQSTYEVQGQYIILI